MEKICIFGTGGFGRETLTCLIDSTEGTEFNVQEQACFMVDDEHYNEKEILGIPVIPLSEFNPQEMEAVVAVGEPATRKKVVESMPSETRYRTIIHPNVVMSEWVEVGEGSIITAGNILTCNIRIGKHAHLNLVSTVGHDCTMGDYFTTAPGVNISGICEFGDCVYFGTNAAIRQGIKVCSNVTIGMGAVVVKNIEQEGIYVGNPAKRLER